MLGRLDIAVPVKKLVHRFGGHTAGITSLAMGPGGKHVVTGSVDRTAIIWDVKSAAALVSLVGHESVIKSVAFSPDGKYSRSGQKAGAPLWRAYRRDNIPGAGAGR